MTHTPRYFAKNGCVYEAGTFLKIVATMTPHGRQDRRFGDPEAQRLAQIAADALNTALPAEAA